MSEKDIGLTFVLFDVQVWIHFEPRDIWIGAYISRWVADEKEVYVCLLPMLPIRFLWMKTEQDGEE